MVRRFAILLCLGLIAACAKRDDLTAVPDPIGDFYLGYAVAVAPNPQKGPFSREASGEAWAASAKEAIETRFRRYDGTAYYHVAVSIDGYVLAQPGIPIVYTPKSVLIFSVTFYEDATQVKLNSEPIQLTVFEACCSIPLIGSGLSKSAEEQMEALSFNMARAIERTMRENGQWFGGIDETVAADPTIVSGNVLEDNPAAVAPEQTPPAN